MRFIKLFENFNNQILTSQETNDLIHINSNYIKINKKIAI